MSFGNVVRGTLWAGQNNFLPFIFSILRLVGKNKLNQLKFSSISNRVASLEQLRVAEFSDEWARPKAYENGQKNVLAIWLDLVSKLKFGHIFRK